MILHLQWPGFLFLSLWLTRIPMGIPRSSGVCADAAIVHQSDVQSEGGEGGEREAVVAVVVSVVGVAGAVGGWRGGGGGHGGWQG